MIDDKPYIESLRGQQPDLGLRFTRAERADQLVRQQTVEYTRRHKRLRQPKYRRRYP